MHMTSTAMVQGNFTDKNLVATGHEWVRVLVLQGMRDLGSNLYIPHEKARYGCMCYNLNTGRPVDPDISVVRYPTQNCELLFQGEIMTHVS